MGIPWNCMGTPGWVDAMDISMASSCAGRHGHPMELHGDSWMGGCHGYLHGKLMCRSPWASHGIAWGLLDGWMPWISPWQAHVQVAMGIPWNCMGTPGWVDAMDISMASSCAGRHGH